MKRIPPIRLFRYLSLGFFLVFVSAATVLHQKVQGMPPVDSLCPFGGLETIYAFLAGGTLIKRIEVSGIFLLVSITLLGILFARFFCGWICALGALQGIFGRLGRTFLKTPVALPRRLDRGLRWLKYVVLAAVLAGTWATASLIIRPYDPWVAYAHLSAGWEELIGEFAVGLAILVVSLLASVFVERAFCRYLCPLGAFNAILSRIPLFRLRREQSSCVSCSACDKACPMGVDVMKADRIDDPECISCFECVEACPTKKGTLKAFFAGRAAPLAAVGILGLAIYAAPLAYGRLTGSMHASPASLGERAEQGSLNVEDIKGSDSWGQVAASFKVDLDKLYREAGVPGAKVPPDTKLKDTGKLAGIPGFEADAVRFAVARLIGTPYAGEGGEAAKPSATAVPAAPAAAPATAPAVEVPGAPKAGGAAISVPADFALEGTMSVAEIAAALKASPAQVKAKLGLPADLPEDKPLKELKDQYGFAMPVLKERIRK